MGQRICRQKRRKKTWKEASDDLASKLQRRKFTPLVELKGANGFPFKTTDNKFIKVILKNNTNIAFDVHMNLLALKRDCNNSNMLVMYEKIEETPRAVHVYYPLYDMDLAAYLGMANVQPNERSCLIKQIAKAVAFLHSNGYVHRDIKLENVMMNGNTPLLCDLDNASRANDFCTRGTKHYMPPDVVLKTLLKKQSLTNGDKSRWLDCYAFGKTVGFVLAMTSTGMAKHPIWTGWLQQCQSSLRLVDMGDLKARTIWWEKVFNFCLLNEEYIFEENKIFYNINDV